MGLFASNKLQPTKHTSHPPDISSYRWHTSRASLSRHALIVLALATNAIIAGLALVVQYVEIPVSNAAIPKIGSLKVKYTYSSLLAPAASLLGSINGFITTAAVAALVNAFAKSRGLKEGLTFRSIEHLSKLSTGGIPFTFAPVFFVALIFLIADSFTRSSIVASLTPTEGLLKSDSSIPFRSFASFADDDIPVRCAYGGAEFGYGDNCPMNDRFGTMYDGGVMTLQETLPANLTRRGVSYPKELLGIAGYISTLSLDISRNASNGNVNTVQSQTFLQTCVPRMKVSVTCQPNLDGTGMSFEDQGNTGTAVSFMQVHQARFCRWNGTCFGLQRPDYGNGAVWVLSDNPYDNGDMPLIIVAVGKYANENMQTNTLYCRISSQEEVIGIRIRGTAVETVEGLECPETPQPTTSFIQNVNFLAQMAMQKQQGEDGRLEILALVKDTSGTRAEGLAPGIQTMVQLGATEMYAALDTTNARYTVDYSLLAQQMRLGQKGQLYQLFVVPPVIYLILLVIGWLWLGFKWSSGAHFSPLDPVQMAVAGAATDPNGSASYAFRRLAGAPTELIDGRVKAKIRLAEVQPERLGLSIDPVSMVPKPRKGAYYGGESVMSPTHFVDPKLGTPSPYGAPPSAQTQSYFPPSVQPLSPGGPQYGANDYHGQPGQAYH